MSKPVKWPFDRPERLESPFLDQELFAGRGEQDWKPSLGALEAESPFAGAFEPGRTGGVEREEENQLADKPCLGIIGHDDRVPVRQAWDVPYRWICQISSTRRRGGQQLKFGPVGTGILISPHFVLTAAHLLRNSEKDDRGQWVDSETEYVVVTPARNDSASAANRAPFGKYEARGWKLCPKYDPHAADAWRYDYAVIELKEPAGAKRAPVLNQDLLCFWGSQECGGNTYLDVLAATQVAGKTAYTAGYPADLGGGTKLYSTSGMLSGVDIRGRTEVMNYDADGCPGQSGSPIWIEQAGKRHLVGVFTKVGTGYNATTGTVSLNSAVRITQDVFDQISHWFEAVLETPWLGKETLEEGAASFEDQESDGRLLEEQPTSERFDPAAVPADVAKALAGHDWAQALNLAIQAGWRDENDLTNLVFFARHPELPTEPLKRNDPHFKQLSAEWTSILDKEVWKAIQRSAENTDLVVSGEEVTDHHRSFFRGASGARLKKLIETTAKEGDLNPGLLGTIMMAETRRPLSYLSSDKVSSYHIGCDDFYEARAAISARVPAYARIKWDRTQKPVEHLNDAQTNPRLVKTILFDSGADAALATAVYVKFREVRLREIAAAWGKDFDSLPLPTRFALTRMAMAAGTGGATPYLKDALNGVDIFVRKAIPVRAYQTQRNATVRTAQAMHLSSWVFGIPVERATPPAAHETETWVPDHEDSGDVVSGFEGESGDASEVMTLEDRPSEAGEDSPHLPLVVERDVPKNSTRVVVVGQRIELDLNDIAFAKNADAISWTIPGTRVRGYDGTARDAALIKLTDADLARPKITFYWVDAADGRAVRARFRTEGGGLGQVVYLFDVKRPTVNFFTGKAGVTQFEKRGGLMAMRFGKPLEAPGIVWKWKVTLPPGQAGYIKDVQTVLVDRSHIIRLEPGGNTRKSVWRHPSRTDPHVQLDGHFDNQAAYTAGLYESKVGAGETATSGGRGIEDSPHTELPAIANTVSVNDRFTYYLMFKPATDKADDAIWVPLARAKWFWNATADQREKQWRLRKPPQMDPGIDTTTVEFPLYHSNVSENEWQDASPAPAHEDSFAQEADAQALERGGEEETFGSDEEFLQE